MSRAIILKNKYQVLKLFLNLFFEIKGSLRIWKEAELRPQLTQSKIAE